METSWQRPKCTTSEECTLNRLCFQGFCSFPCSTELLCPVDSFCNKENICQEVLHQDIDANSIDLAKNDDLFAGIIFKAISELNIRKGFDDESLSSITDLIIGDYMDDKRESLSKKTQAAIRNLLEISSAECGSQCRNLLSLFSVITSTSKNFVNSTEKLRQGDLIKVSNKKNLRRGKINSSFKKGKSAVTKTIMNQASKLHFMSNIQPQQTLNSMVSNQNSNVDDKLEIVQSKSEKQKFQMEETSKKLTNAFGEILDFLTSMKKKSLRNKKISTSNPKLSNMRPGTKHSNIVSSEHD